MSPLLDATLLHCTQWRSWRARWEGLQWKRDFDQTVSDSGTTLHSQKQKEDFEPNLHSRCKDAFALPGDQTETPVIGQATSWMKINGDVIALSMSLHAPKFDSDLSSTTRHRRSGMGNSFLSSDKKIIPVVPKFLH